MLFICLLFFIKFSSGNASTQPLLLPEEKTSTARRVVKPKPITLPVENQPLRERKCLIGPSRL